MQYAICTMHYALCTMHYVLCAVYCVLCISFSSRWSALQYYVNTTAVSSSPHFLPLLLCVAYTVVYVQYILFEPLACLLSVLCEHDCGLSATFPVVVIIMHCAVSSTGMCAVHPSQAACLVSFSIM